MSRLSSHLSVKRILLLGFVLVVLQMCYPLYQTRAHEVGTLILPGAGEVSYKLKMPVYGGLRISLRAAREDGHSVVVKDGVRVDREVCRSRVPEPEGGLKRSQTTPENPERTSQRISFYRAVEACWLLEQYGVVQFELYDDGTGELLDIKYVPRMYELPSGKGITVAQFRNIEKGAQVRVEIKAFESTYLRDRRQLLNRVFVEPFTHPLPGTLP